MSKDKRTGPLPSQLLDPPPGKDSTAAPKDEPAEQPAEDPEEETGGEDVLDRRAATTPPSQGAVSRFPSVAMPPFNPLAAPASADPAQPAKPMFPGLSALMQKQQTAQAPAQTSPPAAEPPRPGGTRYQSDEQMTRNMLVDYADDLLVTVKVSRVEDSGLASEIGKPLGPVPVSIARDAGNYIDVKGTWTLDFRRASDGKPMSKSKRVTTEGPDYYVGWEPRLRTGENAMDPKLMGTAIGEVLKAAGYTLPINGMQQGTVGVPTTVYDGEVRRLQSELTESKAEIRDLRSKLESKDKEIRELEHKNTILEVKAANPPQQESKTSEAVQVATVIAGALRKDDNSGVWQTLMAQERDHSKAMLELALKGKGSGFDDKMMSGWSTLFDGAQKLAKAGSNETGEIAKAFGPVVAQWMAGQQQIEIERMRLKAAEKGIHVQPQQQAPQPTPTPQPTPQQPPPPPADPKAAETAARLKNKSDVFDAMMGAILHRAASPAVEAQPATATTPAVEAKPAASPEEIGIELAMAVRTARYQELTEGHEQHERMVKTLLEDPVASVTELAMVTGKSKEYAEAVARTFIQRYTELLNQKPSPPPVPSPSPSVPAAPSAPAPEVKAESAAPSVVAKGDGHPDDGKGDGAGQATGSVQGADHPDVPGEPSKRIGVN